MATKKKTEEPTEPTQPDSSDPKWQKMQPGPVDPPAPAEPETPAEPAVTPEPEAPEPAVKTFTQAELDAILKERLDREHKKFADYSDLKKKASKLDEIEREQMDEVERLKLERDEARQLAQTAQQQAEQQAISNALLSAITSYQTEKGLGFRKDAVTAALRLVDLSAVSLEGDTVGGVEDAVSKLVTDHGFLLETPKTSQTSPTNPARTEPKGTTDKERQALYFGKGLSTGFFDNRGNVITPPD